MGNTSAALGRIWGPRRLRQADDAVAAALATVMLIAVVIAVSVAATLMFKKISSEQSEGLPPVQFMADDASDRIVVAGVSDGATWDRLGLRLEQLTSAGFGLCVGSAVDSTPSRFYDEPAGPVCVPGPNHMTAVGRELVILAKSPAAISSNSFIEMCGEEHVTFAKVKVIDVGAGSAISSFTFAPLRACNADA